MSALEKPADTPYPIHDLIRRRWSPRAFAERPVEPEVLRSLFEAARWAASSDNEQPWRFIVATKADPEAYGRLFDCLLEGNQRWVHRVPVLVLSVARLTFEDGGAPNRHAFHDVGMAAAHLALQATALGLAIHQMAGFRVDQAKANVKMPDGHEPVAMIAIGYPGDPAVLPDRLRARELAPRERMPVEDFVYGGEWGRPAPPLAG